jgi:hypothetical protein
MPVRQIDSSVKVYTTQVISTGWTLNEKLTCLNVTDGYGLMQQHTAQLKAITPDMANSSAVPAEQTEIDEAKKAMRYNADVEFQITNETAFYNSIAGLWCKVTKETVIPVAPFVFTETIFIGQIFGNNLDIKSLMSSGITAFGLDVLLSHQGAIGSLCYDSEIGDNAINYDAVPPYFNPQGRPNMGAVDDGTNVFDYALYSEFDDPDKYWNPSNIITYLLYQLNNQVIDAYPAEKRYEYFSNLTNTQLALAFAGDSVIDLFANEQKSADYAIGSDSVWATLVQLVEVNGPYTLGIDYVNVASVDYARIIVMGQT